MGFDFQLLENAGIQLIDGDRGKNYPKHNDFMENGYCLFLSAKNVTKSGFQFQETAFINEIKDSQLRAGKLSYGDIILTTRGTVGNVAYYDSSNPYKNIRINSGMIIIRADEKLWNPKFLYFILTSVFLQEQIINLISGSAVPQLPARDIKKFIIPVIGRNIQDKIANIISAFSDKISINIDTNQTLEQMSQTLFKSWFVDFDPAIDNALDAGTTIPDMLQSRAELRQKVRNSADFKPLPADIRALFPAEFDETELGCVPKGWVTNRLENILELAYGKALKKTERTNGDYPVYGSGGVDGAHNEYLVKGPGIIVGRKGTVGSLHWENKDFYPIDTVFFVRPKEYFSLVYCYQLLKTLRLENMNTDAAVPGLNRNNAYRLEVVTPPQPIIAKFTNIIQTIRHKIDSNHNETENLTNLRDTLLPKLISGELSLEDLPNLVAQTEPA
ncbi:restriction endonuclease subunit S [Raoultella ornithinolytica]|jgi:type I restriction enzyme S subunit|uniref:restriction endonuclease subunit S n=1 Tax=Raoultella ornithinolytica TaxID=54291 RepID=UPI000BE2710A|nr:restriction endonuclease subunit S [Raoultella ornithinolytica]ELS1888542.1 restriction endonuclease subunit S [Raoultella ornithinolytica]MCF6669419.1 restriction endonuclease subunit S [Raoultella ornithinolytica]MEB7863305.1 restriction endonuclease subunit S [Raoultella ornithinolytica]MEB7984301.1 restriction endonuclease subunit S [Raoultella ornithinolytica]PJF15614.1 restriction endonuclease subunit S [Raoultella ornithinolytica]